MNVADWRARFSALHSQDIDLTLGRLAQVLARLGNPQNRLGGHVHIAGTNGKGGVVAALEQALTAAGQNVGTYSSPFLWRFEENIRLNGRPIHAEACAAYFAQVWEARVDTPLTWFEADTAVAFLALANHHADQGGLTILECGMGGASDATALSPPPVTAVLTNVGGDHAEFLGSNLQAVTAEKAGIAKGAPLFVPQDFPFDLGFVGDVRRVACRSDEPSLDLAAAVLGLAAPGVPPLQTPPIQPGRWQRVGSTIFDVGHNAHAAAYLAAKLAKEPGPYGLEIGMLRRKDPRAFLAAFAPLKPLVRAVDLGEEGHCPHMIDAIAEELGLSLWQDQAVKTRLVTGSHQTVAKLLNQ